MTCGVELGQNGGHEVIKDRCWLLRVGKLRKMRDRKNIGTEDGGETSQEAIC